MVREYDIASARLTFNGRDVMAHPTDATPRDTELLRVRDTSAASLRGVVEEFTIAEAMRRIGLMTSAPRRVVTAEDRARIDRAETKRARKAAARLGAP